MKLLVSNDDGYLAAGIGALVKALAGAGHEVYVAALRCRCGPSA